MLYIGQALFVVFVVLGWLRQQLDLVLVVYKAECLKYVVVYRLVEAK